MSNLILRRVYTFARADEPGDMTTEQHQRFKDMVNEAIKPEYIHCQNSAELSINGLPIL